MYPSTSNANPEVSPYPVATTGVDLRLEMEDILNEYGHWVMVRHYDTTQRSPAWDDEYGEAIGGPTHPYVDYVVRGRKVIVRSGGVLSALEMGSPVGAITIPYVTYYVRWDVTDDLLTIHDEIYEFPWDDERSPGVEEVVDIVVTKYGILESVDMLGDAGRREYYLCVCRADVVGW